jgi:hypothetical protein
VGVTAKRIFAVTLAQSVLKANSKEAEVEVEARQIKSQFLKWSQQVSAKPQSIFHLPPVLEWVP